MGWGQGQFDNVPRIRSYEEAVAHEARIKPVRGDKNNTKPIGNRRAKYFSIRKVYQWDREGASEEAKNKPAIVVRLYSTDIITYYPDGEIGLEGYYSNTTNLAFNRVLYVQVFSRLNQQWIVCTTDGWRGEYGHLPLPSGSETLFEYKETQVVEGGLGYPAQKLFCLNPTYPEKVTIRKAAMREVRAKHAEFTKYLLGVVKLRQGRMFSKEERVEALQAAGEYSAGPYGVTPAKFMKMITEGGAENYNAAMMMIFGLTITYVHQWGRTPEETGIMSVAQVKDRLTGWYLRFYGESLLEKTLVTDGSIPDTKLNKYL